MRIKEITYQSRRDFKAIFKCPHCGYEKLKINFGKSAGNTQL